MQHAPNPPCMDGEDMSHFNVITSSINVHLILIII